MHRRCLRYFQLVCFNNPPSSPCLRVTLLQTLNTSGKPYHSNILKTRKSSNRDLKNHYINSNKTPINKDKNTYKKRVYNQQEIS